MNSYLQVSSFPNRRLSQPIDARIRKISTSPKQPINICVQDGTKFTVKRQTLITNSDYFRYLFSKPENQNLSQITLENLTPNGFRAFLNFINNEKLSISMNNIEDILMASQLLILPCVESLCMQFLMTQFTDNWLQVLDLVNRYSLFVVGFHIQCFLLNNFEVIAAENERFGEMPYEILFSLVQDPRINITSEFKLFKLVLKWINYKFEERADYFDQFLTVIRLPLMSQDELEEVAMYFNPLIDSPGQDMVNYLLNRYEMM